MSASSPEIFDRFFPATRFLFRFGGITPRTVRCLIICYRSKSIIMTSFEEKKRKHGRGIKEQGRVETEAINTLLEGIYAAEGREAPIDDKTRKKIRKSFHQQKRHGERWWW